MRSGVEGEKNGTPDQTPEGPRSQHEDSVVTVESHCPLCGGSARRRWNSACAIEFVTLVVFAVVARVFLPIGSVMRAVLFLTSAGIALVSLLVLPLTGAVALASRARCRRCGHRFWPGTEASGRADNARFSVRSALIGCAILSLSLVVGTILVISAPGRGVMNVALMMIGRLIMAGLAFGVGMLAQVILWRRLRVRMAEVTWLRFVLLLPAIVISGAWLALTAHDRAVLVRQYDPLVWAPRVLARVQLAALPESACNVRVHVYRVFLTAHDFLRFEVDPNDIERFLVDSPGLRDIRPDRSRRTRTTSYYHSNAPSWYDEPIQGDARFYCIDMPGNIAELIVDENRHAVYVYWGK